MWLQNRQSVPKFGEWTEDVPFTVMFDKASRSSRKNTNKSNPNPNEYPEMNPTAAQTRNQRHDQPPNHNVRPRQERFGRREETEFRPSPQNERNNRIRAPPPAEAYNHQSYGGGGTNPSETNRRQPYDPTPVKPRPISNLRGRGSERVRTTLLLINPTCLSLELLQLWTENEPLSRHDIILTIFF